MSQPNTTSSPFAQLRDDLNYGLAAFGVKLPERFNLDESLSKLADKPGQSTVALVTAATFLFYAAERGHNPKVRDIYDAMIYCTTNISVGYSDIFARTPLGKMIGSVLMTLGPSLAAKTTDGVRGPDLPVESAASVETQQQILATLREIAAKLDARASNEPDA